MEEEERMGAVPQATFLGQGIHHRTHAINITRQLRERQVRLH
jgi:hypothetical protein